MSSEGKVINYNVREKIKQKFDECYEIAKRNGRDLERIPIRFNIRGSSAGQFVQRNGQRYFRINTEIAENSLDEYIKQTIPHEFCHYMVNDNSKNVQIYKMFNQRPRPHGVEWKKYMVELFGLIPRIGHFYDISSIEKRQGKIYIYKCECTEHRIGPIQHKRIQNGREYICKLCKRVITFKGIDR